MAEWHTDRAAFQHPCGDQLPGQFAAGDAQIETAQALTDRAQETLDVARQREIRLGGGDVEQLRHRISASQTEEDRTNQRWDSLAKILREVGIDRTPTNAAEYVELLGQFDVSTADASTTGPSHDDHQRLAEARREVARIKSEIETLRLSGSSVPGALLQIRDEIAHMTRREAADIGLFPEDAERIAWDAVYGKAA